MFRGFSLIEILVVVAMMAVLASLALPRVSDAVLRARGPGEVVRVEGFVLSARNLARRVNRCVQVERVSETSLVARTFSDGSDIEACPPLTEGVVIKELTVNSKLVQLGEWENTGAPDSLIITRAGGTQLPTEARMAIELVGTDRTRTLRVLPLLGFVRVE